ncbi:hypothetical protein D9757_008526 [Collybiopsis confluens]|uniref:Retrotransposon gag domain-containing protein n=1 Tax=Collybiopsis confluens TaxID=2823264 RepID=A0A8H5H2P1_9AGAR|nr:hypothetical protein D9757_008526 [Collybiopsis confluens]
MGNHFEIRYLTTMSSSPTARESLDRNENDPAAAARLKVLGYDQQLTRSPLPSLASTTMSEYDSGGFDLRLNMGPPVMPSPMIPQTPQPSNESAFVQSITHKFNSLDSNFSQLFDEVQKLTSLISQGSAAPQPPPPAPAPAAAPVPVAVTSQGKPPSFEKPDRFKGKSSEVETFVDAIQDAIELQGNSLATERSKCIYMSTFLENSPKQWYRGIKKSHPHLLDNFSLFLKAFIDHFGDSNLAYNATGKLEKLTQTGSAAAYAAKFRELLVYVNWTEESKINHILNLSLNMTTASMKGK